MTVRLVDLRGQDSRIWLEPALDVYVTAMSYPDGTQAHRAPLWREHITRPGWRAVGAIAHVTPREAAAPWAIARRLNAPVARADDEILVGIAYGYRGARDQWWNQQLRHGLRHAGAPGTTSSGSPPTTSNSPNYTCPLCSGGGHRWSPAHPAVGRQARGVGPVVHAGESGGPQSRVVVVPADGFCRCPAHFTFAGDPRPFAFLGRPCPAERPEPARRR